MVWLRRTGYVIVLLALALFIVRFNQIWWWIEIHTGTVNEPGPYYGFFSGFGSDLGEYAIVVGVEHTAYMNWKHLNCHDPHCLWIGRYPDASGQFRYCHRHHPDFGGKPPTREHMYRVHRIHKEKHGQ